LAQASELRRSIGQVAEQVDEVLTAAEDAARATREEAEREAERYLTERRQAADSLLAQQQETLTKSFADLRSQLKRIEASSSENQAGSKRPEMAPADASPDGSPAQGDPS
jgi:hypothetical protein